MALEKRPAYPEIPIGNFVGMISDGVETLSSQGKTDEDIASLIRRTPTFNHGSEIAENYAVARKNIPTHNTSSTDLGSVGAEKRRN